MTDLSTATQLQGLFIFASGIVSPMVVSWLKHCDWDSRWKSALSLLVALVLGACSAALAGKFNSGDVLATFTAVYTLASGFYALYFKGAEFNKWLEKQEPV